MIQNTYLVYVERGADLRRQLFVPAFMLELRNQRQNSNKAQYGVGQGSRCAVLWLSGGCNSNTITINYDDKSDGENKYNNNSSNSIKTA